VLQVPQIPRNRLVDLPLELDQFGRRKTPVPRIHRPKLASIDGQQLAAKKPQAPAEENELPAHALQRLGVVAAEVRDRLEIRRQAPQEPDQLDVAVRLLFQPPAGAEAVEVAVEVEPQQVAGVIARAAGLRRHRPLEAQGPQIQLGHERVQEADRVGRGNIVVQDFGEEHRLRAIGTAM
jgi:hypothetical protein